VPLPGSARCNTAGALVADENAARIPSADSAAAAAVVPGAFGATPLAFWAIV
jgi:hypothetical protein